jgi:tRNA(Ile2) C34 agmatinyltransferase TiaS
MGKSDVRCPKCGKATNKIDIGMSKDEILKLIYYWVDELIDFNDVRA